MPVRRYMASSNTHSIPLVSSNHSQTFGREVELQLIGTKNCNRRLHVGKSGTLDLLAHLVQAVRILRDKQL